MQTEHTPPEVKMQMALKLAQVAAEQGEVPVGALIFRGDDLVSEAFNLKEANHQATHHAEILAIQAASKKLGRWRLNDCELYVTLEPCLMCCGAILQARLKKVFYGAKDPKGGAAHSLYQTLNDSRLNHVVEVEQGLLAKECGQVLTDFFRARRG